MEKYVPLGQNWSGFTMYFYWLQIGAVTLEWEIFLATCNVDAYGIA